MTAKREAVCVVGVVPVPRWSFWVVVWRKAGVARTANQRIPVGRAGFAAPGHRRRRSRHSPGPQQRVSQGGEL